MVSILSYSISVAWASLTQRQGLNSIKVTVTVSGRKRA